MYGNSDILKMVASTAHKDELFLGLALRAAVRSGLSSKSSRGFRVRRKPPPPVSQCLCLLGVVFGDDYP